jgi:hypothetical protein
VWTPVYASCFVHFLYRSSLSCELGFAHGARIVPDDTGVSQEIPEGSINCTRAGDASPTKWVTLFNALKLIHEY